MTMSPGDPGPTDPAQGSAVPPYEGRRESAHVDGEEKLHRDGANVGGATVPAESDTRRAPDPEDTPRGSGASPAEEMPAEEMPADEPSEGVRNVGG
jgi:hypothetical protein